MDANTSVSLTEQLEARGLSVIKDDDNMLNVVNRLKPDLVEVVSAQGGGYVTGWGYELGEAGDETGTAQRLAFLLGIPNGDRSAAPTRSGKATAVKHSHERAFTTHPASVAVARKFVADALSDWQLSGQLDEASVCVSELATNAIEHGNPAAHEFLVRLAFDDTRLRLEVCDDSNGMPEVQHATSDDPNGRGLFLVAALADDWGIAGKSGPGKAVWAEFKIPGPRSGR
ncbi:ATP-binding protein [Streptomyces sp. NPDC056486]|uniref:ATP-binding protein n=1 Tax=Streptomyces sp. NPDC056486 TaxID=3345835 RepID=UPI003688B6D9